MASAPLCSAVAPAGTPARDCPGASSTANKKPRTAMGVLCLIFITYSYASRATSSMIPASRARGLEPRCPRRESLPALAGWRQFLGMLDDLADRLRRGATVDPSELDGFRAAILRKTRQITGSLRSISN